MEKIETLDALIAFNVADAGEHNVELKYSPKEYTFAMIISCAGIILFCMLCILDLIFYFAVIKKKKPHLYHRSEAEWTLVDFEEDHNDLLAHQADSQKSIKEYFVTFTAAVKDKLFTNQSAQTTNTTNESLSDSDEQSIEDNEEKGDN